MKLVGFLGIVAGTFGLALLAFHIHSRTVVLERYVTDHIPVSERVYDITGNASERLVEVRVDYMLVGTEEDSIERGKCVRYYIEHMYGQLDRLDWPDRCSVEMRHISEG